MNNPSIASKRIMLTGGAGFLGSFVTEKLKARGCKHIFIPKEQDYDLTKSDRIAAAFQDAGTLFSSSPDSRSSTSHRSCHPFSRQSGGNRRQPRKPRQLLLRQPYDGRPANGAGPPARRRKVRRPGHHLRLPQIRPHPVQRRRPLERLPRRNQRPRR